MIVHCFQDKIQVPWAWHTSCLQSLLNEYFKPHPSTWHYNHTECCVQFTQYSMLSFTLMLSNSLFQVLKRSSHTLFLWANLLRFNSSVTYSRTSFLIQFKSKVWFRCAFCVLILCHVTTLSKMSGKIWGIKHGSWFNGTQSLTYSLEYKFKTFIWNE